MSSKSSTGTSTLVSLTGKGTSAAYQVNLSWSAPASSSDPIAGYNVYRSPSGGTSYQQLNATVLTETTYVDTTVQGGQTYDYIVESVDASDVTSAPFQHGHRTDTLGLRLGGLASKFRNDRD